MLTSTKQMAKTHTTTPTPIRKLTSKACRDLGEFEMQQGLLEGPVVSILETGKWD